MLSTKQYRAIYIKNKSRRIVNIVSNVLREMGHSVSVADAITLYNILETYMALRGGRIGYDEILYVVEAVYTNISFDDELKRKIMVAFEEERGRSLDILRNIRKNNVFDKNKFFSQYLTRKELEDYIYLRKKGMLRRHKRGTLYVSRSIEQLASSLRNRAEINVADIMKYIDEIPIRFWDKLLDEKELRSLNTHNLIRIGKITRNRQPRIYRRISKILSERMESQQLDLSKKEWWATDVILGKRERGIFADARLRLNTGRGVSRRDIGVLVKNIDKLSRSEKKRLIEAIGYKGVYEEDVIRHVEPPVLASVSSTNKRLKNNSLAANALMNMLKYMLTGDEAYLRYADYLLQKIDAAYLEYPYRPLYESMRRHDTRGLINNISLHMPFSAIETIIGETIALKRINPTYTNELIEKALRISINIMNIFISNKYKYVTGEYIEGSFGRIDLRKSLFMFARGHYALYFKEKRGLEKIILFIDVSGSMIKHSLWAMTVSAFFSSIIKKTVLFSDHVLLAADARQWHVVMKYFIYSVLMRSFGGYTDIYNALRYGLYISRPGDALIYVTDLKQTTSSGNPVEAAVEMIKHGRRLLFIVPSSVGEELIYPYKRRGICVERASSLRDLLVVLRRRLNLKSSYPYHLREM